MTDRYVIVIEVDNKRALAAYTKGLEDLNAIWPELMESAEKKDAARKEAHEAEEAAHAEERRKYKEVVKEYDAQMAALNAWREASPIWRGQRPHVSPHPVYPFYFPGPEAHSYFGAVSSYLRTRESLEQKRNLAGAALGPFRMTEYDVAAMIDWETGETVARIKERMEARP